MNKRRVLLAGVAIAIAAFAVVFVSANASVINQWFDVGKSVASINEGDEIKEDVIATVNGKAIYKSSFDRLKALTKAMYEANRQLASEAQLYSQEQKDLLSKEPTDSEMLNSLIEKAVKVQEANRLNLTVSEDEVNDYYVAIDEGFSNPDNDNQGLAENVLVSYAAGLGMTYDEYRDSVESAIVEEELLVQKLSLHILQESGVGAEASIEEREKALSERLEQLVASAEIVIK